MGHGGEWLASSGLVTHQAQFVLPARMILWNGIILLCTVTSQAVLHALYRMGDLREVLQREAIG